MLQQPGGSNLSLRFSNLVSRLVEQVGIFETTPIRHRYSSKCSSQPVLSRKHSVLLFLQSLASTTPTANGSAVIPPFLPALATNSLAPPSPVNARSPSPRGRAYTPLPPSAGPPSTSHPSSAIPSTSTHKSSGKTKAALLAEWRAEQRKAANINGPYSSHTHLIRFIIAGKPHLPEHLLLRDTLYLLQGISGKYVRFGQTDGATSSIVFADDPVSSIFFPSSWASTSLSLSITCRTTLSRHRRRP